MTSPDKILVIKLGALGDFIQALGPMAAIRKHHPNAHITLLTTASFEQFAKDCGYFDDIWLDKKPSWFDIGGWLSLRDKLNTAQFDRVYDLQNNDRTCFYFKLFKPKNQTEWVGVAKGASHRNTSLDRTKGHAFDGHVQTLALAGITDIEIDTLEWMQADISSFALKNPYILLVPGSAPQHPGKRWPARHYGALAQKLIELGYQPIVIGTKTETKAAQIILKSCPDALDLTNRTSLQQIVMLARNAAGAVGNDTGPMHMIAATSLPCVVLFSGHSNPLRHVPKGKNVQIIQKEDLKDLPVKDVLKATQLQEKTTQKRKTIN